jgi:hypothetical protein
MSYPITVFIFLGCLIVSRIMGERALRQLTPEQKVRLLDGFASIRAYALLPIVLIMLVVFGLPEVFPDGPSWVSWLGLVAFLVYAVVMHFMVARKLYSLDMPKSYTRQALTCRHINHIGLAIVFAGIVYEAFANTAS